jgi:dTDP-4-amino-4,6-dideoxygalactose transaminase
MSAQIPAIEGGRPVRKDYLLFGRPLISEDEIEEVVKTLRSGWLSSGPKTTLFEEKFKEYIGTSYAIGVNSCTAGLHLALIVSGIGEGDEVITTPLTFCATSNTILHVGARPVFVDVRMDDYNIDPEGMEARITPRTKAIVPVHLYGHPCEMEEILRIGNRHGLRIISDCAHAIEAEYKGKKVGGMGDLCCFSFYATKNLTTGEGGMITTNDPDVDKRLRAIRLHGLSADAWRRYGEGGPAHYDVDYLGYKYNMTDIQAAIGLGQLEKIDLYHKRRREYWEMYDEAFSEMEEILRPPILEGVVHAYHLYPILVKENLLKIDRDRFREALHEEGIGTGIHFIPLHLFSLYKKRFGFRPGEFPNAEYIGAHTISLPLSPSMERRDVEEVIEAVEKLVRYYRR